MVRGQIDKTVNPSNEFAFLYGAFDLPGWTIPYLSLAITFEDTAASLKTTYDLPEADQQEWTLEGLFQRDISWPRIDADIIPYLRSTSDPAFFPSITVAMLPYDKDRNRMLPDFSAEHEFRAPESTNKLLQKVLSIGPITLGWYESWTDISDNEGHQGVVAWNLDQVNAVAIDGQHRLGAIKRIIEEMPAEKAKFRNARQPILLLLFEESLGFRSPEGVAPRPLLELIRLLFIDLNKHSKPVHRARLILLEDLEPHARCVREVLAEGIARDISSLTATEPRLPLSLVDWHSETAKFDSGTYLTSVMTLDWAVAAILGRQTVTDFMKHSAIRRELSALKSSLGVDLPGAHARLEKNQDDQVPFTYAKDEVDVIREIFRRRYTPSICHLLSEFDPYRSLIRLRSSNQSLGLEFQHWIHLRQRMVKNVPGRADTEYYDWVNSLAGRPDGLNETVFEDALNEIETYKNDNIAFNVAFQRAYFLAWLEFSKLHGHEIDELAPVGFDEEDLRFDDGDEPLSDSGDSQQEDGPQPEEPEVVPREVAIKNGTDSFVEAMNQLVTGWPDVLSVDAVMPVAALNLGDERQALLPWFWGGTLWKTDDRVIDFSQSASKRAGDLLFMVIGMIVYDRMRDPNAQSDFYEFWNELWAENAGPFLKRVRRAAQNQMKETPPLGFAARIIFQHPDNLDYDEDQAMVEIEIRLKHIWEALGL
jgi:hypothetical protein